MKNTCKKLSYFILIALLTVSIGCSAQKKPLPNTDYNNNKSSVYPNVNLPKEKPLALGVPGNPNGNPRYVGPTPPIQGSGITRLEDSLADDARTVKGVNDASIIVIGKTALVGIDINKDAVGNKASALKKQVAAKLKKHPQIKTVYVSSDPDLLERIQDILEGQSAPDTIGDLYNRMKMEK